MRSCGIEKHLQDFVSAGAAAGGSRFPEPGGAVQGGYRHDLPRSPFGRDNRGHANPQC